MTEQPSTTTRPKFRAIVRADLFRRAMACISTEETRYYLMGVHIEPHPEKGAVLVSTDGHRLICLHDPKAIVENDAIVRPNATIQAALKKCEKAKKLFDGHNAVLVIEGNRMAVVANGDDYYSPELFDKLRDLDMGVLALQWHDTLIDGTFPNWRKVVPKPDTLKPDGPVGQFNQALLEGVATALASNARGRCVRITAPSISDPHLVRVSNPEIDGFAILMPMRGDSGLQAYPKFIDAMFPKPVEPPKSEAAKAGEKVAAMTAARAKTRKARTKVTAPAKKPAAKKVPAKKAARAS